MHKPGIKKSNLPIGNKNNKMDYLYVSPRILITTEFWDEKNLQPWSFKPFSDATRFKLVMKWEIGKNYAITKVTDEMNNLIYYYCDICSQIIKIGDHFEFFDWYLDIIKKPYQEPTIEDESEFVQAVKLGYLTSDEVKVAKDIAEYIVHMFKQNRFLDTLY